jgi:hypothetical protein
MPAGYENTITDVLTSALSQDQHEFDNSQSYGL